METVNITDENFDKNEFAINSKNLLKLFLIQHAITPQQFTGTFLAFR